MAQDGSEAPSLVGVEYYNAPKESALSLRWWLGALLVGAIVIGSFWIALNPVWIQRFGRWGYLGAFFVSMIASATVVLPAPGFAVIMAMGAALDPIVLGIVAGLGSAVGELTGYFAGVEGRVLVPDKHRRSFERLQRLTDRYGVFSLGALAALPLPIFDFAGILAGMMRIRVSSFLVAVSVGKSFKYVILILLGTGSLQILLDYLSQRASP